MAWRALTKIPESQAIAGSLVACSVITYGIHALFDSRGSIDSQNGFTGVAAGEPYTTDPAWGKITKKYRTYQNMDPISHYQATGEFK
eukprot:g1406.t1